jgi:hypothetical protein
LYYTFLQGGASRVGLDKNELHVHKASQFGDPVEIAIAVAKYTSSSSLSTRIPHLEGEEMFGSTKHKVDLPLGLKAESHRHDQVNFSHSKVANATIPIN